MLSTLRYLEHPCLQDLHGGYLGADKRPEWALEEKDGTEDMGDFFHAPEFLPGAERQIVKPQGNISEKG